MTYFERQFCEKCRKLRFCVNTKSVPANTIKQTWLCDPCYSKTIEFAETKDHVLKIMIECGIEDLEVQDS